MNTCPMGSLSLSLLLHAKQYGRPVGSTMGQIVSAASVTAVYGTPEPFVTLLGSLVISYLAYALTAALIPRLRNDFVKIGLKGVDLLKGYSRDAQTNRVQGPELSVAQKPLAVQAFTRTAAVSRARALHFPLRTR